MYPGALAMMISGTAAALAVLALAVLAAVWLARELRSARRGQGRTS